MRCGLSPGRPAQGLLCVHVCVGSMGVGVKSERAVGRLPAGELYKLAHLCLHL